MASQQLALAAAAAMAFNRAVVSNEGESDDRDGDIAAGGGARRLTMVMWFWLYGTRIPALGAAKVSPDDLVYDPSKSLDAVLPPQVQWKAHNYNHLHEAPTVFYAVAIVLAIVGAGDGLNSQLGWAYVALRVVHSLIQVTVNKVKLRFLVFALSSFVLMALVARAAMVVL